jgi:hypothetical protein
LCSLLRSSRITAFAVFRSLDEEGLSGLRVYRCEREVFKAQRTVLFTHNENLFVAQSTTLLREIAKRQQLLRRLQHQLRRHREGRARGCNPATLQGISNKVQGWLEACHMKELFQLETTESEGLPKLSYRYVRRAACPLRSPRSQTLLPTIM